mmetsp:Transcript_9179/g.18406  ORF Transcript_9179/g.18406 Transcript_9179/m.18406 type:complete len:119 (-) Transcript_9179:69-425(-)
MCRRYASLRLRSSEQVPVLLAARASRVSVVLVGNGGACDAGVDPLSGAPPQYEVDNPELLRKGFPETALVDADASGVDGEKLTAQRVEQRMAESIFSMVEIVGGSEEEYGELFAKFLQ